MTDSPTPSPEPPAAKPGILGRLKTYILHPELEPEQIAWSFALGFSIAWNPLLGLHTALVLLFCLLFRRLHQPLMFIGAFINNPWTMVPMATTQVMAGNLLRGRMGEALPRIPWHEISWRNFVSWGGLMSMGETLKPVLHSYLLGGTVLCLLAIPVGYYGMLFLARRMRAAHFKLHLPHLPHDEHQD